MIDERSEAASAMVGARLESRDDRGLMPLAEARRIVKATRVFQKGKGKMKGGTFVLESDVVWAALLSLCDADEFVREAKRIDWQFHVRGTENIALLERYGASIMPWLASRVDARGVLTNIPWCIVPCLLAIDSSEALRVALSATKVDELLPDQAPLGPPLEGLDLARRWLARHADGYGRLAELADSGSKRAIELLAERTKALGAVVLEAIEATLGAAEATRIAQKLALPKATLPAVVAAALLAAETIAEPRGPVWSIAELDDAANEYELPLWDNARYTTGAMRISGFASRHGDALVIEHIYSAPSAEVVAWEFHAYGPGAKTRQGGEPLVDAQKDELERIDLADMDYIDGITNRFVLWGERNEKGKAVKDSKGWQILPLSLPHDRTILTVKRAALGMKGVTRETTHYLPPSFAAMKRKERAALRLVTPDEGLLVQLCSQWADEMFAKDTQLKPAVGLADDAVRLFSFDRFEYVAAGELASTSPDLLLMAEALRRRKKITALPGKANSFPEAWLPICADVRAYSGDDAWGQDEPVEIPYPAAGVGASPYWNKMIHERAYPHGAMLIHAPAYNAEGLAEQTIPYLLGVTEGAMQVSWPRRTAILWARVVGGATKAWDAKDAGVVRAMKNESMLYAAEARALVHHFAARSFAVPRFVGEDFVDVLEALIGARATVEAFVAALAERSAAAWKKDNAALAGAVFELGFVLGRAIDAKPLRDALAENVPPAAAADTDVARALDLVLHGRAGAKRSARSELDYAHVHDDRAWARARILDPKTPASRPSAYLVGIAGEALIAKWAARGADITDKHRLVAQLGKLGGAAALDLLLAIYAEFPAMQGPTTQAVLARPNPTRELEARFDSPHATAARALFAAAKSSKSGA